MRRARRILAMMRCVFQPPICLNFVSETVRVYLNPIIQNPVAVRVSSHWSPYDNGPSSPLRSSLKSSIKTAGYIPKTPLTPFRKSGRRSRSNTTTIAPFGYDSVKDEKGTRQKILDKVEDGASKSKRAVEK